MIFRVPVTDGEDDPPFDPGCTYTLALPTLTGRHHIRVHAIRRERLALVTFAEVRRELGHYRSQAAWRAAWVRQHDRAWCRRHSTASEHDLALRFSRRWSGTDAWVISFVLVDEVRCLPKQRDILSGKVGDGQYVQAASMSIDPEAEAVDATTLERFAAAAGPVSEQRRGVDRYERQQTRQRFRNKRIAMLRSWS